MGTHEECPTPADVEARAYRLRERSLDEIQARELPLCDACREPQLFGCAVGLRVRFGYFELCATCAAKLRDDFNTVQNWRPQRHDETADT